VNQPYRDPKLAARRPRLERILVATLLDAASTHELDAAATLARAAGGSIRLLHVLEALMYASPEMTELARRDPNTHPEASRRMADAIRHVTAAGVTDVQGDIEFGIPADVILAKANDGRHDLLVLGNRGRTGGVRARALAEAKIPVLSVPLG
jgi:nucleotide-binding universal stress UspA family protein